MTFFCCKRAFVGSACICDEFGALVRSTVDGREKLTSGLTYIGSGKYSLDQGMKGGRQVFWCKMKIIVGFEEKIPVCFTSTFRSEH